MKPLTIELTKGAQRQFQFIAWKSPKPDDCLREFYALDPAGNPVVVTLKPAMPEFYDPCKQAPAVFRGEPFPKAVCVEISLCRLLAPPCFRTKDEFEEAVLDPWQSVYWETHRDVWILEPSDDAPLQERLDKWRATMRAAYEHQCKKLRVEIERQTTKPLPELGHANEEQRTKRVSELQAWLVNLLESETLIDNTVCKARLKWTLEDIKNGNEGIRNAYMHEDWAKKNGWDLSVMRRERMVFRRWLETHTGAPANIIDATRRVSDPNDPSKSRPMAYPGIAPPSFGERYEQDPRFLEACASVRYGARFADNANTVVYLADCELREEPTAEELDEVAKLQGAATKVRRQITKRLDKPNPHARFERDFSLAVIPQPKGDSLSVGIEPELQSLLKCIIEAGGRIPRTTLRTTLRKSNSSEYQPEKLLRSQVAKTLINAGLLGKTTKGRTTVYWAKVQAD